MSCYYTPYLVSTLILIGLLVINYIGGAFPLGAGYLIDWCCYFLFHVDPSTSSSLSSASASLFSNNYLSNSNDTQLSSLISSISNNSNSTEIAVTLAIVSESISFLQRFPILSILLHWIAGLIYMFTFASFVSWLRDILREGVLWFFRYYNNDNRTILLSFFHILLKKYVLIRFPPFDYFF